MQNLQSLQSLSFIPQSSSGGVSGIPQSGLFLWLQADAIVGLNDTDPVTTWSDSSPEGNDATQAVAGNKPIYRTNIRNGLPAIRFDNPDDTVYATRQFLSLPNAFSGFTAGEIFWVGVVDNDPPVGLDQFRNCFHKFGTYVAGPSEYYPFTDSDLYSSFGSTARKDGFYNTGGALDSWHIYDMFSAANDWGLYLNNSLVYTTSTNTVGFRTNCRIAADENDVLPNPAFGLAGYIAELILYNKKVATADRTDIYNYLSAKYAI